MMKEYNGVKVALHWTYYFSDGLVPSKQQNLKITHILCFKVNCTQLS